MKKILAILCMVVLSSCGTFKTQYITLDPEIQVKKTNIGKNKRVSLKVSKVNRSGMDTGFGYRIPPNINGNRQGAIYLNNQYSSVVRSEFKKWLSNNNFKISKKNLSNKHLEVTVGYLNYSPRGGARRDMIVRSALKVDLYNKRKKNIYSEWYFIEKELVNKNINKQMANEEKVNNFIKEFLTDIFADKNLINAMVR